MSEQNRKYNIAVAGATGAVGGAMLDVLERRDFPVNELRLLASERSVGKKLKFRGQDIEVGLLSKDAFDGIDVALFSAGASRSLEFAPAAAAAWPSSLHACGRLNPSPVRLTGDYHPLSAAKKW